MNKVISLKRSFYSRNSIGEKTFEKREEWTFHDDRIEFELTVDGIGTSKSDEMWHRFYKDIAPALEKYYRRQVALGYYTKKEEYGDTAIYRIEEEIRI